MPYCRLDAGRPEDIKDIKDCFCPEQRVNPEQDLWHGSEAGEMDPWPGEESWYTMTCNHDTSCNRVIQMLVLPSGKRHAIRFHLLPAGNWDSEKEVVQLRAM